MGPIGIVLSARHKHSTPAGTSTKHTHALKHRQIGALYLVRCMYSGLVGGLLFAAFAAFWPAFAGWRISRVCAFGGFPL